jgi:dipeptidyl aminopeptidase/acylaminoacyl peptidase
MNTQHLSDELLRSAIARRVTTAAEGDLRQRVLAATAATPQRRGWRLRLDGDRLRPQGGLAFKLTIALVLLATVALLAALVGYPADRTPDDRLGGLAYLSGGDLYVAGPAGESRRLLWDLPQMGNGGGSGLAWLDSETVLLNTGASFLVVSQIPEGAYVVDVTTGAHREVAPWFYFALSPDHRVLAVSTSDEGATPEFRADLIEVSTGVVVGEILDEIGGGPAAWSPDGRSILSETSDSIYRVDIATSHRTVLVTDLCCGLSEHTPVWSPDGSRVVYVNYHSAVDGTDCTFRCGTRWSVPAAGGEPTRITPELGSEILPAFSPDGRWIAYMSDSTNELTLIAADGSGKRVLAPVPESFPGQDSDPDRAFQWDADSTGITFLTRAATLWHVTLDGAAKQLDGSSIAVFAQLGSQ